MHKIVAIIWLILAVSLPSAALGAEPDWLPMDENDESSFFYDRNGTVRLREGVVQVRTRIVYSEKGKGEAVKVLKGLTAPERLYESRYMHEIDCLEQEGRLLAATHFDKEGAILRSTDLSALTFSEYLSPGTRMATVANQACGR